MTPSLFGRWSTRLYLFIILGSMISLIFAWLYRGPKQALTPVPFYVLGYVLIVGLILDIFYHYAILIHRWEYDWPAAYKLIADFAEGLIVFLLITLVGLPGIPKGSVDALHFWLQYCSIWFFTYFWVFFLMRAIFVRWRARAGQFGKFPAIQ